MKIYSINDNGRRITLLSLSFPLLFQSILNQIYGTLGTMQMSGYSDIAVSGTGIACSVINIASFILNMVVNGTVILSAVAIGADNREKVARYAGTSSIVGVLIAAVLSVIGFIFAGEFITMMNLEGDAYSYAVEYLKIRIAFLPVSAVSSIFSSLIICNGFPKITIYIGFFGSTLSLILGYIALYTKLESIIDPKYSMAIVANICQLITFIITASAYKKHKFGFKLRFHPGDAAKILRLGIPGGMALLMYMLAQTITTSYVADMGIDAINTKIYISGIVSYIPMLGYSISQANSVFMGRFRGSGDFGSMKILFRQNTALALITNIVLTLVVFIFHRPLMSIFTDNPDIINASGMIFLLDLLVEIPRAINNVSENSLNPNGDVKITFITSTLSCWLGSVLLSYILCVVFKFELVGIWIAFIADESIKAIIYLLRWKSDKWQKTKI